MNLSVSNFVDSELKKIFGDVDSTMIYNGVQKPREFNHETVREGFLTVAVCRDEQRFRLKGIDLFIEAATHFPNEKFVVVGSSQEFLSQKMDIPGNVTISPPVPTNELVEFYSRTKYYCQFSMVESFGLALAEAMTYGCIPIVVDRGALKEVTQGNGIIIKSRNIEDIILNIRINLDKQFDTNIIINHASKFSMENRNIIQKTI
jgi:glycosyltransferase involved in cell wall biosynthesis